MRQVRGSRWHQRMAKKALNLLRRYALCTLGATLLYLCFLAFVVVKPMPKAMKWSTLYYDQDRNVTWIRESAFGLSILDIDFRSFDPTSSPFMERRVWLDGRSTISDHASRLGKLERRPVPRRVWHELSSNGARYRSFAAYDVTRFVEIGTPTPWIIYGLTQAESKAVGPVADTLPHRVSPTAILDMRHRLCWDWLSLMGGYGSVVLLCLLSQYTIGSIVKWNRRRRRHCVKCNYSLGELSAQVCPECGSLRSS